MSKAQTYQGLNAFRKAWEERGGTRGSLRQARKEQGTLYPTMQGEEITPQEVFDPNAQSSDLLGCADCRVPAGQECWPDCASLDEPMTVWWAIVSEQDHRGQPLFPRAPTKDRVKLCDKLREMTQHDAGDVVAEIYGYTSRKFARIAILRDVVGTNGRIV